MAGRFSFNTFRSHVARRDHHCAFCHGPITKGTPYLRFVGMWQGDFQNWAIHEPCQKVSASGAHDDDDGALPQAGDLGVSEYLKMFDKAGIPADGLWFGGEREARWRLGLDPMGSGETYVDEDDAA